MEAYPNTMATQELMLLKFLISASEYSAELSRAPEYGTRIFNWYVLKKRDDEIKAFLKKVAIW